MNLLKGASQSKLKLSVFSSVLLLNIFVSLKVQAEDVGTYRLSLAVEGSSTGSIASALSGWSCHASTSASFSESIPDHKGNLKAVTRKVDSDFKVSLFSSKIGDIEMNFDRNMSTPESQLKFSIFENCSKTSTFLNSRTVEVRDFEGKVTGTREETFLDTKRETAVLNWDCKTQEFPQSVGDSLAFQCDPPGTTLSDPLSLDAILLRSMRDKKFKARIDLKNKTEKYIANLCETQDDSNAVIIRVTQGLGGHMGENDFEATLNINGKDVAVNTPSGLLWGDIKYCGPLPLEIKAKGVEKDLFFDDLYSQGGSGLKLSGNSLQSGTLRLTRKSYTGWTDKDHDIKIDVIRPAASISERAIATQDASQAKHND